MKVVAVIPVFNEERHIARCLASLDGLVDGVVALDDGSTDRTLGILTESSCVWKILRPPAAANREWHDAKNHRLLNEALTEFTPDWVIRIDADETFDDSMKAHLATLANASPEIRAFAFRRFLLDEESRTRSTSCLDIVRMYRYSADSQFASRRLHVLFEPTDVTRAQIRMTNIRLWHHTGYTEELREQRYEKFKETDPLELYQDSYENLLKEPSFIPVEAPEQQLKLSPWTGPAHGSLAPLWQHLGGERVRAAVQLARRRLARAAGSARSPVAKGVDKAS